MITLAVAAPLGCSAILGLDGYKDLCPPEGEGKAGDCVLLGGSGGNGSGSTSSTVGPACHSAKDCPPSTTCASATCEQGHCGTNDADRGTTCSDHGGQSCDGNGKCVECLSSTDCKSDTLCVKATCNAQSACVTADANAGAVCNDHGGNVCDGMGSCVGCNKLSECPATGTTCATVVACTANQCTNMNASAGAACTDHGGNLCDGQGHCYGAAAATIGQFHACALTTVGGVKCWGRNNAGQLGDGTHNDEAAPIDVPGLTQGIAAIVAGQQYECALTTGGGMKCWGDNPYGQLGTGDTNQQTVPTDVVGLSSGVASMAANSSNSTTCAVMADGTAKCWGDNSSGQLGSGFPSSALTPTDLSAFSSIQQVVMGDNHICALDTNGVARCMGSNNVGQLGDGTMVDRSAPVRAGDAGLHFKALVAGGGHTCGIDGSNRVFCWGANNHGHLGDGSANANGVATPTLVPGLVASALAAGPADTCALTLTGVDMCWGDDADDELGVGNPYDHPSPTGVLEPRDGDRGRRRADPRLRSGAGRPPVVLGRRLPRRWHAEFEHDARPGAQLLSGTAAEKTARSHGPAPFTRDATAAISGCSPRDRCTSCCSR